MSLEMVLPNIKLSRGSYRRQCDTVTLDRDASDTINLRFLVRDEAGRRGSRVITIEPDLAEELVVMLTRELDADNEFLSEF